MYINPNITIDKVLDALESDEYLGFCVSCGHQTGGVEPDARKYKCPECGEEDVYGVEEILEMIENIGNE